MLSKVLSLVVLVTLSQGTNPVPAHLAVQAQVEGMEMGQMVATSCFYDQFQFEAVPTCPSITDGCSSTDLKANPLGICMNNHQTCDGLFFPMATGAGTGCALKDCEHPSNPKNAPGIIYLKCTHAITEINPAPKPAPAPAPAPEPAPKPAPEPNPNPAPAPEPNSSSSSQTTQAPQEEATQAPTNPPANFKAIEAEILRLVNEHRAAAGKAALCINAKLQESAEIHSGGMVKCDELTHDGCPTFNRDLATLVMRINDVNYAWNAAGENVTVDRATGQAAFDAWKNSPGHNANMLDERFTQIGIGVKSADGSTHHMYFTQVFGKTPNEPCVPQETQAPQNTQAPQDTQAPENSQQTTQAPQVEVDGGMVMEEEDESIYAGAQAPLYY